MRTKKIALVLALCMASYLIPHSATAQEKEKPLWEIIADSFKDFKIREQDKVKPLKVENFFQSVHDTLKEGSSKAKGHSLRGN